MSKCHWKNGVDRLAWCSVATSLQFVKRQNKTMSAECNKNRSTLLSPCQRPPWDVCSYCSTLSLQSSCQIDLLSFLEGNNHNSEKQRKFSVATYWSLAEPGFKLKSVSLWIPCLLPLNVYLSGCVRSWLWQEGSSLHHAESFFAVRNSLVAARGLSSFQHVDFLALRHVES